LKELVAAGDQRLDPLLATIADAARQFTGASGAALAMWKDGAMLCRARSGETAPALGARLNAETGISGECLRTGKIQNCDDAENHPLVDLEVCRRLGLRSIAVLPIQGWRGVNGVLEVFSPAPAAFSERHLALLQQLAVLAERARAAQPHGASSAPTKRASSVAAPQVSGLLPASDRVGDVVLASMGTRSRPLVLGCIGCVAILLLALMIWLGWRGPEPSDAKAQKAVPTSAGNENVRAAAADPAFSSRSGTRPPDNDRVWKADPGGERLFSSNGRLSGETPVTFASQVDVILGKRTPAEVTTGNRAGGNGSAIAEAAKSKARADAEPELLNRESASADKIAPAESPEISEVSTNPIVLNGVLSASAPLPVLSGPVSQGVSGGRLLRRVDPVYPTQALLLRLQGTVRLSATVAENGSVRDVKVVEGSAILANAASDAVKRWHYQPFQLDGKPVANEITVSVEFKLPADRGPR